MLNYPAFRDGTYCELKDLNVSILDLGFIHCDATYDVISVKNGEIQNLDNHLMRFGNSCAGFRLPCPDLYAIQMVLEDLVDAAPTKDLLLWLCVTRGIPTNGNPRDLKNCAASFMAYAKPYFSFNASNSATVCLASQIRNTSIDQTLKNFAWNDLSLAQWEAIDRGYDTAILTDGNGYVTEGPGFNVGFIIGDTVYAPKESCLRGTVMENVRQLCKTNSINFVYTDVDLISIWFTANAMFLTSTAGNVINVTKFEDVVFKENDTITWLQQNI